MLVFNNVLLIGEKNTTIDNGIIQIIKLQKVQNVFGFSFSIGMDFPHCVSDGKHKIASFTCIIV